MKIITPKTVNIKKEALRRKKWEERKETLKDILFCFLIGSRFLIICSLIIGAIVGFVMLLAKFALWMIPVIIFIIVAIFVGNAIRD
jgi:hypothetical protein